MKNKYLDPKNYYRKFGFMKDALVYSPFYSVEKSRNIENEKFDKLGFDLEKGKEEISHILEELGKDQLEFQSGMGSIHWLLFSCIKQVADIDNILELGTYDGETALVLSKLFPDSSITTVDLPANDPIFSSSYGREDEVARSDFNDKRNNNLRSDNINYVERNSFFLAEEVTNQFDLVWVDAGHLYPEISWDICNGYNLCKINGWILCDDIIKHKKGLRDELVSPDSFLIWEYINERIENEVMYFLKRNNPKFSANPKKRKYVSILKKTSSI